MNKKIYSLIGYLVLALIPVYFLEHQQEFKSLASSEGMKSLLTYMPYLTLGIIAFLGTRLNQTRVFFSSLFLLGLYQLGIFESFDIFFELPKLSFYKASLISIPLCISSWLLCKESALSGNRSLGRMFIGLSPLLIVLVIAINDQDLFKLFTGLKLVSSIDSYIISYALFVGIALVSSDKKISDFKLSMIFSLIPIGAFAYSIVFATSKTTFQFISAYQLYWSLCFSVASVIMLYSMFKMYWQRVYLDEMTSLPNRRALDEKVGALGKDYAIAMIDVDNFKKFNDTYGHDQGDDVLKLVAKTLESVLGDKVYRYGGEEFAAVFADKAVDNSKDLIEKAREKLAGTKFTVRTQAKRKKEDRGKGGGKKVSVTFSAGVSHVNQVADTPDKVIKLADNALYKAKKKGRNCVVVAA